MHSESIAVVHSRELSVPPVAGLGRRAEGDPLAVPKRATGAAAASTRAVAMSGVMAADASGELMK